MFRKALGLIKNERTRNVTLLAAGTGAVIAGRKLTGLTMFAEGFRGLEANWRDANPDYGGGMGERWKRAIDFYEETHTNDTNRWLHIVGIPFIVGGAAGILVSSPLRPVWALSLGAFAGGWALNFVGHGVFERAAPAFADDPLSLVAGPVWEITQLRKIGSKGAAAEAAAT